MMGTILIMFGLLWRMWDRRAPGAFLSMLVGAALLILEGGLA